MTDRVSDEQLLLVIRHGSGPLERALAAVLLAKRKGLIDELRGRIEGHDEEETDH